MFYSLTGKIVHMDEYQQAHCAAFLKDRRFYPFADSDVFYESFTIDDLRGAPQQAGFQVLFCRRGNVYTESDGTVLHCLCAS